MMKNIDEMFGKNAAENGVQAVSPGQLKLITLGAEAVLEETIPTISIALGGSSAKISMDAKGNVRITRAFASKIQMEA